MGPTGQPDEVRPRGGRLALAVFGGTAAWAVRFALGYLLVPMACASGDWVLHGVTLATALAAAAFLVLALRWARAAPADAVRFTLYAGAALNAFFLAAILLEGSGVLFVDACLKGALP